MGSERKRTTQILPQGCHVVNCGSLSTMFFSIIDQNKSKGVISTEATAPKTQFGVGKNDGHVDKMNGTILT